MQWTVNIVSKSESGAIIVHQSTKYPSRSKAGKAVQIFCNGNKGAKVVRDNDQCVYTISR